MRLAIVFNARASSAAGVSELILRLPGGSPCLLFPLADPGDVSAAIADALAAKVDRLVVAGGDGTVHQVVQALAPDFPPIELAILPLGTGNDFARSLGVDEGLEQGVETALNGPALPVDLIRMRTEEGESWLVNVANGGFGGRVATDLSSAEKGRWGALAYWMSSIAALTNPVAYEVELTVDDERHELSVCGVAIANGRFVGGGFPVAPGALLDDGLIDVTTVDVLPTFDLMAVGVDFALGRDRPDERVHHYRGRTVRMLSNPELPFSIDGETSQPWVASFEAVQGVLRIATGPNPPAFGSAREEPATSSLPEVAPPAAAAARVDSKPEAADPARARSGDSA